MIFLASALVMILEIIGAKFLTPILGGSQIIWISQILITLLSLSIGAYISSFSFFKENGLRKLSYLLIGSSIYFIVIIVNFQSLYPFFLSSDSIISSLKLSLFFYFFSLTTLGISFPLLTLTLMNKFSIPLGKVSFVSTLGSVIGTLLTYFLVSFWTNDVLLLSIGILLVVYGCILLFMSKQSVDKVYTKVFALTFLGLISYNFFPASQGSIPGYKIISRMNSHFGEITLLESDEFILVANDKLVQNKIYKETKKSGSLFNYFLMDTPFLYKEDIKSALVLGLGAGVVSSELMNRGVDVDSVEINDKMIEVAREHFGFTGNVFLEDARIVVKKSKKKYDLVVLDAFLVDSVPKHLLTTEFFSDIKSLLTPDGLLVINSFGKLHPLDLVSESTYKTLSLSFNNIEMFSINEWNVFYLVSNKELVKTYKYFEQPPAIQTKFSKLMESKVIPQKIGQVITDNDSSIEVWSVNSEYYRKSNSL